MANYGSGQVTSADPLWVATHFVSKYYDVLAHHPEFLQRFYKAGSTLTVTDMGSDSAGARISSDLEAIQELVNQTVAGAKATTKQVDAQFSINGGVLLHVSGTMARKESDQQCSFEQTFFLATQENGFYVHNDMIRVYPAVAPVPTSNGIHAAAPASAPQPTVTAAAPAAAAEPAPAPAAPPAAAAPKPAPAAAEAKPAKAAPQPAESGTASSAAPAPAAAAGRGPTPTRTTRPAEQPAAAPVSPAPTAPASWAALVTKTPGKPSTPVPGSAPRAVEQPAAAAAAPAAAEPASAAAEEAAAPGPAANGTAQPAASTSAARQESGGQQQQQQAGRDREPREREREVLYVIQVRNLPQEHLQLELLEQEFGRFGKLKMGPPGQPVAIHNTGREMGKVAYVKYEDPSGVEAALQANVTILDRQVEIRRHEGPLPSYTRSGAGRGPYRGPSAGRGGPPSGGPARGDGMRGGRGPRPEGSGRGERRPSGGPGAGTAGGPMGGRGSGGGRGGRAGSGGGRGGSRDQDGPSGAAPAASKE